MFTTAELFGRFHSPKKTLKLARDKLSTAPPQDLEQLLAAFLPPGLLSPADQGPNSRQRVYSLRTTFWTFLYQVFTPSSGCSDAVSKVKAWFAWLGRPKVSTDTSPYCQARHRLEPDTLQRALKASAQAADKSALQKWRFHDLEVLVGDGTASSAPDTPANQRSYPQSARQNPGCGFPLIRLVGLFSLSTGALQEVALGNKHQAELTLFRKIWDHLKPGMLFLADRGFCDFVTLAELLKRNVHSVLRLNGSRSHDFRRGKRLGRYDCLVTWFKPKRKPRTATRKLWLRLPDQITLRLIRYPVLVPGFRTHHIILVTTLLDADLYPVAELAQLYLRRWRVELFLRHIKTTLHMDTLQCKTPHMLYREIMMHLIAYNFLRCLMVQAASIHDLDVERISFKGSLDTLRHYSSVIARARSRPQRQYLINDMLSALAQAPVPNRPNRVEPRYQKRRRKAYPFMTKPRAQLKARLLHAKTAKNQRA
jgi:hypothetical protein